MSGRLFTYEAQDREAFRTMLARLGIDSHAVTDAAVAAVREQVDEWAQQESAGPVRPGEEPTT